jgi:hypothetical protein
MIPAPAHWYPVAAVPTLIVTIISAIAINHLVRLWKGLVYTRGSPQSAGVDEEIRDNRS